MARYPNKGLSVIYLNLDSPFDPGSYDAGNTYPHALVTSFNMAVMEMVIEIRYAYGTFDPTKGWVSGQGSIPQVAHVQGDDFIEAISAMPVAGEQDSVLMAAARECYNFLAKSGAAKGTVVDGTVEAAPTPAPTAAPSTSAGTATGTSSTESSPGTPTQDNSASGTSSGTTAGTTAGTSSGTSAGTSSSTASS